MLTYSILQDHRCEHSFSDVHDKQELKIKEGSEENAHSNSNEAGGTVSHDEINL